MIAEGEGWRLIKKRKMRAHKKQNFYMRRNYNEHKGRADGILIRGCHIGDCHYQDGNKRAEKRAEAITLMLEDFGLEEERFRLEWISALEGPKFVAVAEEMTKIVKELGPNPYKS
jgi:F420-non-reducing hydrogenase iron-sulfur subunit